MSRIEIFKQSGLDETWIKAKDLLKALEYSEKSIKSYIKHIPEEHKEKISNEIYVNRAGLFRIVCRSNKPKASELQKYIFESFIPFNKSGDDYLEEIIIDSLDNTCLLFPNKIRKGLDVLFKDVKQY